MCSDKRKIDKNTQPLTILNRWALYIKWCKLAMPILMNGQNKEYLLESMHSTIRYFNALHLQLRTFSDIFIVELVRAMGFVWIYSGQVANPFPSPLWPLFVRLGLLRSQTSCGFELYWSCRICLSCFALLYLIRTILWSLPAIVLPCSSIVELSYMLLTESRFSLLSILTPSL